MHWAKRRWDEAIQKHLMTETRDQAITDNHNLRDSLGSLFLHNVLRQERARTASRLQGGPRLAALDHQERPSPEQQRN